MIYGPLSTCGEICVLHLDLTWNAVYLAPPQSCKLVWKKKKREKPGPYSDNLVKRFCLTVSPFLTLSFSSLINTDGQPDSSGGQNPSQDRSLSSCYHLNGFSWGPSDTGERGNEFMKILALRTLHFAIALPPFPLFPLHSRAETAGTLQHA